MRAHVPLRPRAFACRDSAPRTRASPSTTRIRPPVATSRPLITSTSSSLDVYSSPSPSPGTAVCIRPTGTSPASRQGPTGCVLEPAPRPFRRSISCCSTADGAAAAAAEQPPAAAASAPYWKTYISRKPLLVQAVFDCLANIRSQGPVPEILDVALVFVSSEYLEDLGCIVETLQKELPGLRNVFGCTGFGIIGGDADGAHELEAQPGLSVTLVSIPQAEVVVRHLEEKDLPDGDAPPDRWSALLGVPAFPESPLSLVVLSDPSFSGVQDLLAGLDFAFPAATKIGGLSSSSTFGGSRTATLCWSASSAAPARTALPPASPSSSTSAVPSSSGVHSRGASVMCLLGEVQMDLMIAQGCRPLTSTTWTVDRVAPGAPTHVVALSSEGVARGRSLPALEAFQIELQSVLGGMTEVQLRRTVANLTVGVAPEGLKNTLEPQDFLIRALRGFDAEQCLVVGEYMRVGQRVRFMVRDKQGAQEDLTSHGLSYKRKQLQAMLQGGQAAEPFGMLMFTCNGRGSGLYGEDSYDARTMSSYVPVPCAGFQCNGEIGRVGNTTHLHGFTCAVGVLRLTTADLGTPASPTGATAEGVAGAAAAPPTPSPATPASGPSEESQQQPSQQQPEQQ